MNKNIVMVAAENDSLPNAKIGGIGDVMRDIPRALREQGCTVHTVIPCYGYLHLLPGAQKISHFPVEFGRSVTDVGLYLLAPMDQHPNSGSHSSAHVFHWVLHHPEFYPNGVGAIYCNDDAGRPFATDATKFALFSAACGQALLNESFGAVDYLHLHDWHAALIAVLREYSPRFARLKSIKTVFSVHNLSLQGVRPFAGDPSSLDAWFPYLRYDRAAICDPRVTHCLNPMRAAIQLCDKVHAVSPSYAREIQIPSYPDDFIYGGEGLEPDLAIAARQHRLVGILNGCEYPEGEKYLPLANNRFSELMQLTLLRWVARQDFVQSAHWIALQRVERWLKRKDKGLLITSVGRLTEQKVRLLKHEVTWQGKKQSTIDHLLDCLGNRGSIVILGTGQYEYERFFTEVLGRHDRFIYLQGYSNEIADALYKSGHLFLMPSSFEPCGISQMLAMRAGQPCLAHRVGGLNDTIENNRTGFLFGGSDGDEQALACITRFQEALHMICDTPDQYQTMRQVAAAERFTWDRVAAEYLDTLYTGNS